MSTHWFLNRASIDNTRPHNVPGQVIKELKSFDDFGMLSTRFFNTDTALTFNSSTPFMDQLLSYDSSLVNAATIPTVADPSELGGSSEAGDIEQLEELLDEGYDLSAVLRDMTAAEVKSEPAASPRELLEEDTATVELEPHVVPAPSPSGSVKTQRFDPDVHREYKASAEEVFAAVEKQEIALLRSILMEKKWPDHRRIGACLDRLFELVIRESVDTDEAVMFLQDFAVCNRRGFLHDVNGIRLALRVARDNLSVPKAVEMLRMFRNMFLVKSPMSKSSIPTGLLEEFYATLCTIGSSEEVEDVQKVMVSMGFDKNCDTFMRAFTSSMLKRSGVSQVFREWRKLSTRYGTSCGSEMLWEGIFSSPCSPAEQARLAGSLLKHCRQYDHPSAVISGLVLALVRLQHFDAAKAVFTKVAVPGRFLKKVLSHMARRDESSEFIENVASLVTECMFSEKGRVIEAKKLVETPSAVLSPELCTLLDSFYGLGRPKQYSTNKPDAKRKLLRVNDEQLFELSQCIQLLWLEKAEKASDSGSVDRLLSWSAANKLEIPPRITQRIAKVKSVAAE